MAQQKKSQRHPSALKAQRQAAKRNIRNRDSKKRIREAVRGALDAASSKDGGKAKELSSAAYSAIDKAARTGALHWKTAARRKSRLAKRLAAKPA